MDGSQIFVTVSPLQAGDECLWDEFVRARADGSFFHLSGWKRVIERAFGHRTHYLIAERGGAVTGVLPLTHVKSRLFGSSLISNAFAVQGGPIETEAVRLMDAISVPVLELRGFSATRADWLSKEDLYASFRRAIEPSIERNLKLVPRKQRAMIRKGISNNLQSEIDHDIHRLYRIYSESVHNLGTPVFSKYYFQLLREEFNQSSDIVTVTLNGRAIASVLNFYFRDEVLPFYGGGGRAARALAANDFMYWEVMRMACERGYRLFDFGRSKVGTGSFAFKRNWGFQPMPLVYQYRLAAGHKPPDLSPLNPKFGVLIALWKRLPLAVATCLGPLIVRGIG